jgi:hypothetical protein
MNMKSEKKSFFIHAKYRRKKMKKIHLKYIINAMMFVDLCAILFIGLVLGLILTRGGHDPLDKYFLGLHRHDWSDIHYYLSLSFICLVMIHLSLNWSWIIQSTKKYFGEKWKNVLFALCGSWIVLIIIIWIATKV